MARTISIILTAVLYFAAFYQSAPHEKNGALAATGGRATAKQASLGLDAPYFDEGFVNDEEEGTICHVSSISQVGEGKMGCTWYAGSREGSKDVAIFFSTFEGGKWDEPRVIVDKKSCSAELKRHVKKIGNSALFRDNEGRLWLFYASVFAGGWSGTSLNYKISHDEGDTWSVSKKLVLSPFFNLTNNIKNGGLNLEDGGLMLPVYHEFINKYPQILKVKLNESGSVRYAISKITGGIGDYLIQPAIVPDEAGGVTAFFRNCDRTERKFIRTAKSADMGDTWSEVTDTALPNPNSGFDVVKLSNGDYLAVINNTFEGRGDLSMVLSKDKGKSWKLLKVLEKSDGREYSYPSIGKNSSGNYFITYTYERRKIKYISCNEAWLRSLDKGATLWVKADGMASN